VFARILPGRLDVRPRPAPGAQPRHNLDMGEQKDRILRDEVFCDVGIATIGDRATVVAGRVVTKGRPADVLATGSPARVVRQL